MANIVFIAVQCCQCSTMQVKQQKRNSNRWTCAVCNEKQSVRKVFARGFMAKDIRKFVQSFNMSRSFMEEGKQLTADCEASFPELDGRSDAVGEEEKKNKKKRVDWSEYMDGDDIPEDEFGAGVEGGELESKIVTEWPDEFLKRPKKLKTRDFSHGHSEASYKPNLSKRSKDFDYPALNLFVTDAEKLELPQVLGKDMKSQSTRPKERLTGKGSIHGKDSSGSQKMQTAKPTAVAKLGASKWEQYIEENTDGIQCLRESNSCDPKPADDLAGIYDYDLEVEEDIHPDFL